MAANDDWNVSGVIDNSIGAGGAANNLDCTPDPGAVEICNYDYGVNNWLGVAGIYIAKGKQITKGYVKVNDFYYAQDFYNNASWQQLVMCQEVGHIFGLAHQDETFDNANLGTCMDYTDYPEGGGTGGTLSNLYPNQHDYDQLDAMYGADEGGGNGGGNGGGGALQTERVSRAALLEMTSANGVKRSAPTATAGLTSSSWTWAAETSCSRT